MLVYILSLLLLISVPSPVQYLFMIFPSIASDQNTANMLRQLDYWWWHYTILAVMNLHWNMNWRGSRRTRTNHVFVWAPSCNIRALDGKKIMFHYLFSYINDLLSLRNRKLYENCCVHELLYTRIISFYS